MTQERKKNFGTTFLSYLRRSRRTIVSFLLLFMVFGVVYSLYALPWEPYIYSLVLAVMVLVIIGCTGFWGYWRRYQEVDAMKEQVLLKVEALPHPKSDLEAAYQELLGELRQAYGKLDTTYDRKFQDMMEYYTLWVHQIKTPIAAMYLLLQQEKGSRNAQLSGELFKIEQYAEMVLGYLRLDSTRDLLIGSYELDGIIRQVIRKYARLFILKKLQLEYEGVSCQVLTDEKWLVFVLEQIISNALKYTRQGKVSIHMDETREMTLVIEDTGMGIHPEDIPRVFEKGFTGYNGRQDKKSTGIGLYLSKKVLDMLHHRVEIHSGVGSGTRVLIDLNACEMEMI